MLTDTLDALAREPDPDMLPKHAVQTIVSQLGAHGASIWERNKDALVLLGAAAGGRFQPGADAGYFEGSVPVTGDAPPLWVEALQSRMHFIIEDVDTEPSRIILADGRSAMWHQADLTKSFADQRAYLAAAGIHELLLIPMMFADRLAGMMAIRLNGTQTFTPEEINLTKALAHQAMLAIELSRLSQEGRRTAVVAERIRMARDIHDTIAQGFTGVIMQLEAAKNAIADNDLDQAIRRLELAGDLARSGLGESRRSVMALRPSSLQDRTLSMALDLMLKRMTYGVLLQTEFHAEGIAYPLPAEQEEGLLRIGQEALTNTIRYADAKTFRATLTFGDAFVELHLVDDGRGFETNGEQEGFGLVGMKERADQMGAQLTLRSAIGQGVDIQIRVRNPAISTIKNKQQHA